MFGGMPGAWKRIAKRAKLEGVTLHILRHSFASIAVDLGYSEPTIAAMLGHSAATVTSRYIHHLDVVLIAAADRVAAEIHCAMTGLRAGPSSSGKVSPDWIANAGHRGSSLSAFISDK